MEEHQVIRWFREWMEARRERKVFEALYMLAEMEDGSPDCDLCDDDPQACICGELDCD